MTAMTSVDIVGVYGDRSAGAVVLLGELPDPVRVLPIVVGSPEATAIGTALIGLPAGRPGTHDLMAALLRRANMRLDEVAITELREGTFYAELFLETPDGLQCESARPSDALALALRCGAPIVVATAVLDEAAVLVRHRFAESPTDAEIDDIVAEFSARLATAAPSDFESSDPHETVVADDEFDAGVGGQRSEGEPDEDVGFGDD